MRAASLGNTSSIYSGSNQFRIPLLYLDYSKTAYADSLELAAKQHQQQAANNGNQTNKTQLAVFELYHTPECFAPRLRRNERQQPFKHQHEPECGKQYIFQATSNLLSG